MDDALIRSGTFSYFFYKILTLRAQRQHEPDRMTNMDLKATNSRYSMHQRPGLVHVEWTDGFTISLQTMRQMWADVLSFSRVRQLNRVLIEGHQPVRDMKPIDAFRHGSLLSSLEPPGLRIAFCLFGFEPDVVTWLFSRTANDGPTAVEIFSDLPTSLRWIGA